MIVRNPKATWTYVLEADRKLPRDQQTVWRLRHLTLEQEHEMVDGLSFDRDTGRAFRRDAGSHRLSILRRALVGFSGLRTSDGTEVQFEAGPLGGVKDEVLFRIPLFDRMELAGAVENELAYDPDEAGKSEPPSVPGTAGS